jgi:hypothetical protein
MVSEFQRKTPLKIRAIVIRPIHSPISESPQLSGNKDTKPKNIRLMRYAEVLLIYAEAAANLNNAAEAMAKLNMVRARVNLRPLQVRWKTSGPSDVRNLRWKQTGFFDLVRQGRAGAVLRAHGKPFVDESTRFFRYHSPSVI